MFFYLKKTGAYFAYFFFYIFKKLNFGIFDARDLEAGKKIGFVSSFEKNFGLFKSRLNERT